MSVVPALRSSITRERVGTWQWRDVMRVSILNDVHPVGPCHGPRAFHQDVALLRWKEPGKQHMVCHGTLPSVERGACPVPPVSPLSAGEHWDFHRAGVDTRHTAQGAVERTHGVWAQGAGCLQAPCSCPWTWAFARLDLSHYPGPAALRRAVPPCPGRHPCPSRGA